MFFTVSFTYEFSNLVKLEAYVFQISPGQRYGFLKKPGDGSQRKLKICSREQEMYRIIILSNSRERDQDGT